MTPLGLVDVDIVHPELRSRLFDGSRHEIRLLEGIAKRFAFIDEWPRDTVGGADPKTFEPLIVSLGVADQLGVEG
jgi:hypothetical protein